jgi:hypothetical protein
LLHMKAKGAIGHTGGQDSLVFSRLAPAEVWLPYRCPAS